MIQRVRLLQVSVVILVLGVLTGGIASVFAQAIDDDIPQFNIARTLTIADEAAIGGDVMSLTDQNETLGRSTQAYDERMYGVLVVNPVIVYRTTDDIPVARDGEAMVNVTTLEGTIAVGDYITSSPIPGKAQKATEMTGHLLGVALQSFGEDSGESITHEDNQYRSGSIKVAIGIGPASPAVIKAAGGLFGTLQTIASAFFFNIRTSREFERIIRYIIAALIAVLIIYIAYRTFGRNITKGIEAIGRNPLARVSIQSMIVLNAVLLGIVSVGGILLSLAIISL